MAVARHFWLFYGGGWFWGRSSRVPHDFSPLPRNAFWAAHRIGQPNAKLFGLIDKAQRIMRQYMAFDICRQVRDFFYHQR
jgi:hypothetical protein